MGRVYRVRHTISDRVEAMKVVLPGLTGSPEALDRFLREIKIQASLSHPNIASLYTAQRAGDEFYMFLELVEGISLHERLEQGPMELTEAIGYIVQVLDALNYAHERGVIHRDIKPRNILITADRAVKLTDFGIATSEGEKNITRTGSVVGSLYYMSPEQVKGNRGDARSDIYSAAVMLYELAVGKRPFDADSDYGIMAAHIHQIPAPPIHLRPSVPAPVSQAISKALEKDPAHRFQTAKEFKAALQGTGNFTATMPTIGTAVTPFDAQELDKIKKEFAIYIGPMARVLVDRMSKRAQSTEQLYQLLADEIPSASDRSKFLSARRK